MNHATKRPSHPNRGDDGNHQNGISSLPPRPNKKYKNQESRGGERRPALSGAIRKKGGLKIKLLPKGKSKNIKLTIVSLSSSLPGKEKSDAQKKAQISVSSPDGPDENTQKDDFFPLLKDTLLAIQSLVQRGSAAYCAPASNYSNQGFPFVLRHMVHSVLRSSNSTEDDDDEVERILAQSASTGVMREIEELTLTNDIRCLYLGGGSSGGGRPDSGEDIGIMEEWTYIAGVRDAISAYMDASLATTATERNECLIVFNDMDFIVERFIRGLQSWTKMTVSEASLLKYYDTDDSTTSVSDPKSILQMFLWAGILLPQKNTNSITISPSNYHHTTTTTQFTNNSQYYFSLPHLGKAMKQIQKGRTSLATRIKRSYHKEISLKRLEEQGAPLSELPLAFHVRDALSLPIVKLKEMPSGSFLAFV